MLKEGELVWVDFNPVRGSEQAGARPALVVSASLFHSENRRATVCPITRNVTPWPTKIILPEGLGVAGGVLADQIRSVDRAERGFRKLGAVPDEVLRAVRHVIGELLGLRLPDQS